VSLHTTDDNTAIQQSVMSADSDSNEDTKSTSLLPDVTDDSCRFQYIEIVPLKRDTGGPYTTDRNSGDVVVHAYLNPNKF